MGSGDITWHDHIEAMASQGLPLFMATGASSMKEVDMAMSVAFKHTKDIVLMHATQTILPLWRTLNIFL